MTLATKFEGALSSAGFMDRGALADESVEFQMRWDKDCVELRIVHSIYPKGGRRTSQHMLHSYTPEAFNELCGLLNRVARRRPL